MTSTSRSTLAAGATSSLSGSFPSLFEPSGLITRANHPVVNPISCSDAAAIRLRDFSNSGFHDGRIPPPVSLDLPELLRDGDPFGSGSLRQFWELPRSGRL